MGAVSRPGPNSQSSAGGSNRLFGAAPASGSKVIPPHFEPKRPLQAGQLAARLIQAGSAQRPAAGCQARKGCR
jgi:hypothetical protein